MGALNFLIARQRLYIRHYDSPKPMTKRKKRRDRGKAKKKES